MDCLSKEYCDTCLIEAIQTKQGHRCPWCESYNCYTIPELIKELKDRVESLEKEAEKSL